MFDEVTNDITNVYKSWTLSNISGINLDNLYTNDNSMTEGEILKKIIIDKRVNIKKLSSLIGISRSNIYNHFKDIILSPDNKRLYEQGLGIKWEVESAKYKIQKLDNNYTDGMLSEPEPNMYNRKEARALTKVEQIKLLVDLLKEGAIDDKEFKTLKKQIIGE